MWKRTSYDSIQIICNAVQTSFEKTGKKLPQGFLIVLYKVLSKRFSKLILEKKWMVEKNVYEITLRNVLIIEVIEHESELLVEYGFVNDSIKMFEDSINKSIEEFEKIGLEKLNMIVNSLKTSLNK